MKIVLTGSTGFIGREILAQCAAHNYITDIYTVTRRPLPADLPCARHPKVTQLLHEDFGAAWPAALLARLRAGGVEGCIWALGDRAPTAAGPAGGQGAAVAVEFPARAAADFARELAPALDPEAPAGGQKFPFRFVFVSGWGAERDAKRTLWAWSESRKLRGAAERAVFEVADGAAEVKGRRCFEAIALRPGGVLAKSEAIGTLLWEAVVPSVTVDRLARSAVRVALQGTGEEGKRVVENTELMGSDWAMVNTLTI